MLAMRRAMVFVRVRRCSQRAGVALVPRLATAGTRTLPLALLVSRRRL